MPFKIDRASALARLGGAPRACLPCSLAATPSAHADRVAESEHAIAQLSRYPVRWGHVLVVLRRHVTCLADIDGEVFGDASRLAHRVGVALELELEPARCYVAALGTDVPGLPMTFAHLHFNVVPVPESGARPRDVLTWSHGVYDGSAAEWRGLAATLRTACLRS